MLEKRFSALVLLVVSLVKVLAQRWQRSAVSSFAPVHQWKRE